MRKRFFLSLAVLLLAPFARAAAEDPAEMFSDESLQAVALSIIADEEAITRQADPRPQSRRPYWTAYAWLTAATIYDIESTFYYLGRCIQCYEQNPIMRPFVERGRLATYLFSATVNGVIMYIAKRMFDRGDPWWRFGPITVSVVHVLAGTWNLYESSQPEDL